MRWRPLGRLIFPDKPLCCFYCFCLQAVESTADDEPDEMWEANLKDRVGKDVAVIYFIVLPILWQDLATKYLAFVAKEANVIWLVFMNTSCLCSEGVCHGVCEVHPQR